MYVTTVRIPDELAERVKTYCAGTGASVNGALLVALERLVSVERQQGAAEASALLAQTVQYAPPRSEFRPDPKPGMKP